MGAPWFGPTKPTPIAGCRCRDYAHTDRNNRVLPWLNRKNNP